MSVAFLTSPMLSAPPHISHGFFTREGGASDGLYAGLNCGPGSGDDAGKVAENRSRAARALGAPKEKLVTLHQIHSAKIMEGREVAASRTRPEADGIVTNEKNLLLGILTADCAPILLADAKKPLVAAVHAGWKGAFAGIAAEAVKKLRELGASEIIAAIGPALAQKSFEVGQEFVSEFINSSPSNARYFIAEQNPEKAHFNLKLFLRNELLEAGVAQVDVLPQDTYTDETKFYSYRRATHRNEPDYGRQLSAIMLKE